LPLGVKLGKFGLKPKQYKVKRLSTPNFIMRQIWLGALKLAIFLAHAVLFVFIISATLDAVTNATTKDLQNAFRLVRANFIVGTLGFIITIFFSELVMPPESKI